MDTEADLKRTKDYAHRPKLNFTVVDLNREFSEEFSENSDESPLGKTTSKDKLTKKLQKTIAEYEELLQNDTFNDINEKNDARKVLRILKNQLDSHMGVNGETKIPEESVEERREKALHEIFAFYARQHIPPGLPFEQLEETLNNINIGELMVFCKDFGIQIPRNELMLIYKRESENNMPHKFKQFKQVLRKLSELLHGRKIVALNSRIKEIKDANLEKSAKLSATASENSSKDSDGEGENSDSGSENKDDKSVADKKSEKNKDKKDSKETKKGKEEPAKEKEVPVKGKPVKEDPKAKGKKKEPTQEPSKKSEKSEKKSESEGENSDSEGEGSDKSDSESAQEKEKSEHGQSVQDRLNEERERLEEELEELTSKTKDEIFEEFLKFLEIDDPSKYKRKAKGLRLAFDVKDTKSRIPLGMNDIKPKKISKKSNISAAEIKEKVKQMKEDRIKNKIKQEIAEKTKYEKNREQLKHIHEKLRHDKLVKPKGNNISYTDIKVRNMGIPTWEGKHTKVTLDVLSKMHYSDFNIDDDDDFKPTDILDDDEINAINNTNNLRKKNKSINKIAVHNFEEPIEPKVKNINKRGVQLNQSQMADYRNRSALDVSKAPHKAVNQAYDYGLGAQSSAKNIHKQVRDERSVPRVAQSLDHDYSGNPRTKQATIKNRLALGGSQSVSKNPKSMHYRRATQGNPNIKIQDAYQLNMSQKRIPTMKQQMNLRAKQIESTHRDKEKRNMDSIMKMHDKQITKGLKTVARHRY